MCQMISRKIISLIIWCSLGGSVLSAHPDTPLTKCCSDSQYYVAELDICRHWKGAQNGKLAEAPTVHSIGRGAEAHQVGNIRYEISHRLQRCPVGFVGMSTADFLFYEDGSMHSSIEQTSFQNGSFCIHEAYPTGRLVARYCIPDPCKRSPTCIRKCCPINMAFEESSKSCQNHTEHFRVILRNQTGYPLDVDSDHLFVRDGVAPQCRFGYKHFTLHQNAYHILSDGRLLLLPTQQCNRSQVTQDYCIDNVILPNANSTNWAFVCLEANNTCHYGEDAEASEEEEQVKGAPLKYYPVFMFVSAIFLVATFVVYVLIPEIRNIHGVVIMCYVFSRAVAYLVFGTQQLMSYRTAVTCRVMSILIHFSYLSTYTWLNVVCFDIWWTLRSMQVSSSINQARRQNQLGKPFFAYSLYSWGLAAVIVLIGQLLDYYKTSLPDHIVTPGFGQSNNCWFLSSNYNAMYAYVYGPVFATIFVDVIFFVVTGLLLRQAGIGSSNRHDKEKYRLRVIFALFVLKIVSWIAEFIAYGTGTLADAAYAIDVIEALSSVLTFAIFVCKTNIWNLFKRRCPCLGRLESYFPDYSSPSANRFSNPPTASTSVSTKELLHMDLVKTLSRSRHV